MNRRHNNKAPTPPVGRQRASSDWQRPASFSYYASRNDRHEKTNRQQAGMAAKRSRLLTMRFWLRRSGMLAALLLIIICVISILSLSNKPRIVVLDSSETSATYALHSTQEYEAAASAFLKSSIWNGNKVTVDTGAVAQRMQQRFPELDQVTVTLPLVGHRPIVYLHPSEPVFVVQAVSGSYVLSEDGKILINKDAVASEAIRNLPLLIDQSGVPIVVGRQLVSGQKATFMTDVVTLLGSKGMTVQELILPARAAQQLDVRLAGEPYIIKFLMDGSSVRQQVGTFIATKEQLAGQNIQPVEYIDVRVAGRAYYK